jgi:glycosyltransferase involved in cell wall biosynthesis
MGGEEQILKPLISIIMPVYNSDKYLAQAIDSILNQSISNFEFLILNDGSDDSSFEIINYYSALDPRIVHFYSSENKGLIYQLNEGIRLSKGQYVARMDSDDESLPERLELQVNYLDEHRHISIVGSQTITIDEKGNSLNQTSEIEQSPSYLFWKSFFQCPLKHPTVMIRKSVLSNYQYEEDYLHAEDYRLWTSILQCHDIAVINKPLLKYRVHSNSISKTKIHIQRNNSVRIVKEHWGHFFPYSIDKEIAFFLHNYHRSIELYDYKKSYKVNKLLKRLYKEVQNRYVDLDNLVFSDYRKKVIYLIALSFKRNPLIAMRICLNNRRLVDSLVG